MAGRRSPASATRTLRDASAEATGFLREIGDVSEWLSARTSETLCGTLGGTVGASLGYAAVLGFSLPLAVVPIALGAALGIVGAILCWRGPRRMWSERKQRFTEREFRDRVSFVMQLKKALGPSASPDLLLVLDRYPMTGFLPGMADHLGGGGLATDLPLLSQSTRV